MIVFSSAKTIHDFCQTDEKGKKALSKINSYYTFMIFGFSIITKMTTDIVVGLKLGISTPTRIAWFTREKKKRQ
jgi:hypothetical protein